MRAGPVFIFAVAFVTASISASADTRTAVPSDSTRASRVATVQSEQRSLLSRQLGPKSTAVINTAIPGLPVVNPVRAYPPSCLADPLPDQPSGPTYTTTANLAALNASTGETVIEGVTITLWRVACSSTQFFTSATLMRIKRQSQYEGDGAIYPLFPGIRISQGSTGYAFDPNGGNLIRVAQEPNTVLSDTIADTPIVYSTTYVLENYPFQGAGLFDFNLPFGLQFDNFIQTSSFYYVDVPAYNPTSQSYPAAFQNLPISGYMSTNWSSDNAFGEGIVLQVYEIEGNTQTLNVSLGWFAYDQLGVPYWLFGNKAITRGAKIAAIPMLYLNGGGLGGGSGSATSQPWGSVTISFPDCNNMIFNYASNPGLPAGVPQGSGNNLAWTRNANVNALSCE